MDFRRKGRLIVPLSVEPPSPRALSGSRKSGWKWQQLRAALSGKGERNFGGSGYVGAVWPSSGREAEGAHHFIEFSGVLAVLDLRDYLVSLDATIYPNPEGDAQRDAAQLLWRIVERKCHVSWLRRPRPPTSRARVGTAPLT